jgi:hypothetical protein
MLALTACLACVLASAGPEELRTYREAADRAGRDPEAHVRLALWCEAQGLDAERVRHLGMAVLADPSHALARGLLGLVRDGDGWGRPDVVRRRVAEDAGLAAGLAEYNARRDAMQDTAGEHWRLARWCDERGLEPEAEAHATAVTRLSPNHAEAWKRLGFVPSKGRWVRPEQVAAEEAERKAQLEATARWRPRLESLRARLTVKSQRDAALAELAAIDDPRAIPAIGRVFASGRVEHQQLAVQLLGQIDTPAAAGPLVLLAVAARDPEVRRAAGETLARRDVRESLDRLIELIRTPVRFEVVTDEGQGGRKELRIEGEAYLLNRRYSTVMPPPDRGGERAQIAAMMWREARVQWLRDAALQLMPALDPDVAAAATGGAVNAWNIANESQAVGGPRPLDPEEMLARAAARDPGSQRTIQRLGRNQAVYERAVATAEARFQADLAACAANNAAARQINDRILPLLAAMTGRELGDDRLAWRSWWSDEQGYSYRPPEKVVLLQEVPQETPRYFESHSCFAAGTLVATLDGPRPIETLRIGDRVLAQDSHSGELSYQPVLSVYHNPPSETRRIAFEGTDEAIVATPIHRFWKAGRGWVMARDLKPGDPVRTLGGVARVAAVETAPVQPVFNLEVARLHSFLVGRSGTLVHDNSLIDPVTQPFDAPPATEVLAGRTE